MYAHPYLLQMIAEEHTRGLRSTAATARLARLARRTRRAQAAQQTAAVPGNSSALLGTIPRPRDSQEETAHRAA